MDLTIDQRFRRTTLEPFVALRFSDAFNDEICPAVGVQQRFDGAAIVSERIAHAQQERST